MINKALLLTERYFAWSNVYGLARTILALGTMLTLLLNGTDMLFVATNHVTSRCDALNISLYCILPDLEVSRWISIFVLFLVVIGWKPMVTGLLHWYVAYSFISSATVIDGGDHIASIITLLLVPVTLTDTRAWHWSTVSPGHTILDQVWYPAKSLLALSCLVVIKIQVAVIYLNSAVGKTFVDEWKDGTAIYYWFKHPLFGYPSWLRPILEPLILDGSLVFLLSWGTIIFELILFAGLFMDKRLKKWLLVSGVLFHFLTVLIHGLGSFFFTMTAALILYLSPIGQNYSGLISLKSWFQSVINRYRTNSKTPEITV
jgi:antimicrobial peptide system protein, SdpB family